MGLTPPPRTPDGRYAEKPEVGLARRMTEVLRERLGHDGTLAPVEPDLPTVDADDLDDLTARVDVLAASPLAVETEVSLDGVETLTGAALVLGTDTLTDTAEQVLAMGKSAPLHLLYEATVTIEETKADKWNPRLHPRDGNGRFIEVGAVLNLLGSVGGGRGTVIGNGPNNMVTVRREDGSTLNVPGDQTYADGDGAPEFGTPGTPGKPGSFARTPAAAPAAAAPAAAKPEQRDPKETARRVVDGVSKVSLEGDGKEAGAALARRNPDLGPIMEEIDKIADGLDDPQKADYLHQYTAGYRVATGKGTDADLNAGTPAAPDTTPPAPAPAPAPAAPAPAALTPSLLDALNDSGGFTVDVRTGDFRSDGFAVAVPNRGKAIPAGQATEAEIDAYLEEHKDEILASSTLHLGGWVEDDGTTWLDLSEVYDTQDQAYAVAQARGEIAIADLSKYANGEDGTIAIEYNGKPPTGPAADKWDDPNSGILKGSGNGEATGSPDSPEAGRNVGPVQGAGEGSGPAKPGGRQPGGPDGVAGGSGDGGGAIGGGRTYTQDEVDQALQHYKGLTYARMNEWLRTGERPKIPADQQGVWDRGPQNDQAPEWVPLTEDDILNTIETDIGALRQFLKEQRTTEPMTVYRGATGDWTKNLAVGSVINDAGFTSASDDIGVAQEFASGDRGLFQGGEPGVVLDIDMPSGAHAIKWDEHVQEDMDVASTMEDEEQEWIIAPGSSFRIVEDLGVDEEWGTRRFRAELTQPVTAPEKDANDGLVSEFVDPSDLNAPSRQPKYDPANNGPIPGYVHKGLANVPLTAGDTRPPAEGTVDDPIDVQGDINKALEYLAEGRHVRLNQPDEVATLLDKLREVVAEAKARGEKAPTYDLCRVSVPGTNLFCAEHKGIPRIEMPQLGGIPLPNTPADKMEKNEYGGVDLTQDFIAALGERGVKVTDKSVPASHLRASQMELDGAKVSGISAAMAAGGNDTLNDMPIFVTRDNYVIDGHHRWAAKVGLDVADGHLGDVDMNVRVVDMDIGEALDFANAFAKRMGIPQAGVADNPVADREHGVAPADAGQFEDTEFSLAHPDLTAAATPLAEALAAKAESQEPQVTQILNDAVTAAGGRMEGLQNRLKKRSTLRDKIVLKSIEKNTSIESQAEAINDALRYTAILEPGNYIDTAREVLAQLEQQGFSPLVMKNSWPKNDDYSGVNGTLVAPDGSLIELQFHTADSWFTKDDVHDDYEIASNRDGKRTLKEQRDAYARMAARWDDVEQPKGWEGFGTIKFNPPPTDTPSDDMYDQQIDALRARLDATTSETLRESLLQQIANLEAAKGGAKTTAA